jgi:hypothetical protein
MIAFTIEPNIGPLPLRFGMTPKDVEAILGAPDEVSSSHFGSRAEQRKNLSLGYSKKDEKLIQAVFSPGSKVMFQGKDLFRQRDPIALLRKIDSSPQLCVGFVVFPKLGIRFSGFHDDDDDQKAIGVTNSSYWDKFADDFEPFE